MKVERESFVRFAVAEYFVFAAEVVVDIGQPHPGIPCDLAHRGLQESFAQEQFPGGLQQAVAYLLFGRLHAASVSFVTKVTLFPGACNTE